MPVARPTPMDLAMHGMAQSQASVSMTIGGVLHLEGAAPPLADLRAHVAANLTHTPRLTYYLKGPGLRARWARDPKPDLERRIVERRVEPGEQSRDAAVEELLAHPLPEDGPQWDLWLLHGHAPNRYTLCLRVDHAAFDGGGLRNTLYTLFGDGSSDAAAGCFPRSAAGVGAYAHTLRSGLGFLSANNLWNDPARPLQGARASSWAQVPTDVLRSAGAARGGSSNDALLAALAGALRTWGSAHLPAAAGRPTAATMMVNLRRPEEAHLPGNRFNFVPLLLPTDLADPAGRLDTVVAATKGPKTAARRAALRGVTDRTPARAFRALTVRLTTSSHVPVDTSHLAFHHPLRYRSHPVTRVRIFTWLPPRHPASIVACSYNGTTSLHFLTDRALPGFDRLAALWEQETAQFAPERSLAPPVG